MVRGGRAVTVDVEGVEVEHKMSVAKPGRKTARAYGLNTNHHVRVWCSCMDRPVNSPGTFAGQHATVVNERSQRQGANDPRRLGGWDWLGVADVREPGSALNLFRAHIREVSNG